MDAADDSDEPITKEWMESIGFNDKWGASVLAVRQAQNMRYEPLALTVFSLDPGVWRWSGCTGPAMTTRGEMRMLMQWLQLTLPPEKRVSFVTRVTDDAHRKTESDLSAVINKVYQSREEIHPVATDRARGPIQNLPIASTILKAMAIAVQMDAPQAAVLLRRLAESCDVAKETVVEVENLRQAVRSIL